MNGSDFPHYCIIVIGRKADCTSKKRFSKITYLGMRYISHIIGRVSIYLLAYHLIIGAKRAVHG